MDKPHPWDGHEIWHVMKWRGFCWQVVGHWTQGPLIQVTTTGYISVWTRTGRASRWPPPHRVLVHHTYDHIVKVYADIETDLYTKGEVRRALNAMCHRLGGVAEWVDKQ